MAEKFEAAYLRSLAFDAADVAEAERVYRLGAPSDAEYKVLQDYLFRYVAAECGRLGMAVHLHTMAGAGGYFDVAGANPLNLESVLNDPGLRKTKFVMVHGGWPFTREITPLLEKPNAYLDFSGQSLTLSPATLAGILREWLEHVPEKVMFATDAYPYSNEMGWEEGGWVAAHNGREALGRALTGMVRDGEHHADSRRGTGADGVARKCAGVVWLLGSSCILNSPRTKEDLCVSYSPFCALTAILAAADEPLLLQKPTLSKTHIVFAYAGDLWSVPREGGDASRLTSGAGIETDPAFSPDGTLVAFTGEYDGNVDVFVMPASGGVPKRLTWHPSADTRARLDPGRQADPLQFGAIRRTRASARLFTCPGEGGVEEKLPLPTGYQASMSPDGQSIAYEPTGKAFTMWKRYRGGQTARIWLARLSDSTSRRCPRTNSNDFNPMWAGDRVFFLSDRNGPVTLFSYDMKARLCARPSPIRAWT